jgi:hypothetical protein
MNISPSFITQNNNLVFTTSSTKGNCTVYVLLLKKNDYGLRQAGNNWFNHLSSSLLARGFTQSSIDPCLFTKKDFKFLVSVHDCLLFAKTDTIIASLKSEFNLASQGSVGAFLGVDIQWNIDGHLELVQPGLIQSIISLCGLKHESNEHKNLAYNILHADLDGFNREHSWKYAPSLAC